MLTIRGSRIRYCDGLSRRGFLTIGGFAGMGMLGLPQILRAAGASSQRSHKAIINIFLGGGPPHQDMFDLKMDAPDEIRGEFKPIDTAAPGIQIGECFPQIAKRMDKFTILRSIVGAKGGHDAVQCMTGYPPKDLSAIGGRPSIGSAAARVLGAVDPSVPPFVGLAEPTKHMPWSDSGHPGFLGAAYNAFRPDGPGMQNLILKDVTTDQLHDRKKLLAGLDQLKRSVDASGFMTGIDSFNQRAFEVLTSSKLVDALDLKKETPALRERYGDGKPYQFQFDGAPTVNEHVLLARRLVEVGVRVVSLSYGRWDSHSKNFDLVRDHGAKLDQCVTALVDDLEMRGMLQDVLVIAWGEFGRTPRINKNAGRDHWPQVSCALLAGGGLKHGQVIGSTNRLGEFAKDRPITFPEIFATLYHHLGIDPMQTTIEDPTGRPRYLVDHRTPMRELV